MGAIFILLGLAGFGLNNLLGAHLTAAHNLIHLASGAASLYLGLRGSLFAAKWFCISFGIFYLGLGIAGYWFGYNHMESYLPMSATDHAYNQDMFRAIPGYLELGTIDHLIHLVIGTVYILAGALTRTRMTAVEFLEGNPE